MTLLHTSIEIAASPAAVRAKFLDFAKMNQWHDGFIKSVTTVPEGQKFEPGVKLHVIMEGMTFDPTLLENTEDAFVWRGSLPGVFTGDHAYRFKQGQSGPNSTTFVQEEVFSGLLSFIIGDNFAGRQIGWRKNTEANYKKLNEDLKKACEQQA